MINRDQRVGYLELIEDLPIFLTASRSGATTEVIVEWTAPGNQTFHFCFNIEETLGE